MTSPFQVLIATIHSAQSTDETVNRVTKDLFKKYRTPKDFAVANPAELEKELRPTGFFRNKTKSVIGAGKKITQDFGGEVPRTMDELLLIPGVARKTANVVLGTAFGIAVGVVVDTHVIRLSESSRPDAPFRSEENRAGLDARDSEGKVDRVFASADLARPQDLPGTQTQMRGMQPRISLLFQGQDSLSGIPRWNANLSVCGRFADYCRSRMAPIRRLAFPGRLSFSHHSRP